MRMSLSNHLRYITDVFTTDVIYILPAVLKWIYRRAFARSIVSHKIRNPTSSRTTSLFVHQNLNTIRQETVSVILILHGDYGHPSAHLNLADMAASHGYAVFSLFLFYRTNPSLNQAQIKQAITTLEQLIQSANKRINRLVLIGHSRGAVEAAYQGYVEKHPKITDIISIAGRLKILDPSPLPCKPALQATVESIWNELNNQKNTLSPRLYQVVALQDQAVDHRTSAIRDENRLEVNAGHCGILFHPTTLKQISAWLCE